MYATNVAIHGKPRQMQQMQYLHRFIFILAFALNIYLGSSNNSS